jgi:acetolactate synthase regulatory subunit
MSLTVDLRPGAAALVGVVSVLHSRAANVTAVTYAVDRGAASIQISVVTSREGAHRLATQINRRIDVLDVRLTGGDDPDE